MAAEESLRSKRLYKLEILILKFIPFFIAIAYFANTTLSVYGIDLPILSYTTGLSLVPFIFLLLSSFVFRFCSWHRIPLYYIVVNDLLNIIDSIYEIPIENRTYLGIHIVLFFICFITVFALRKKCNNDQHIKTISTKDSRRYRCR